MDKGGGGGGRSREIPFVRLLFSISNIYIMNMLVSKKLIEFFSKINFDIYPN